MKAIHRAHQQYRVKTIGLIRRGYSTSGGAEAYLKRLAEGLLARGYRVVLLGTGEWPLNSWPGGEMVAFSNCSLKSFAKKVLEYKKNEKIDLLFSLERVPGCDIFRAGDGVHAAWLEHRKKRESSWRSWLSARRPSHRETIMMERELFAPKTSTLVIANSAMVAQEIREYFEFPQEQLYIIPNGVPLIPPLTSEERRGARELFGISEKELMLLFVGSGWKRKGVDIAIQAVQQSRSLDKELHSSIHLWVAGRGSMRGKKLPAIHLLGPVKNIKLLYHAADLFILPTVYDPFSNASLEALMAGLPVITTTANGCSEVIEEGVHGSIIQDPNNVEAFASAILFWQKRLLSNKAPAIRDDCRKRGASFDMNKNLEQTIALMEQVLAKDSLLEVSQ